ncbi:MAG: S8 family serine peptidase, partial [Kiritimatiellae bacterium]|nr:S8 family serine peptidase [Kiritimatiellia bacterium]
PAEPVGETNGVDQANLALTDADGNVLYSTVTGTNGEYIVTGLVPGTTYWVRTETAGGSTACPPFATLLTATEENLSSNDVVGHTYGEADGHLTLAGVTIDDSETGDGDGWIDNGETIRIFPRIANDGALSVKGIRASLTTPDAFERDSCMAVAAGDVFAGSNTVWAAGTTHVFDDEVDVDGNSLEVTVSDTAADGDLQRFYLEVWEERDDVAEPKRWYFDFSLAVAPRYTISGTVLDGDGNAVGDIALSITGADDDTSYSGSATADGETGEFFFSGLEPGKYAVAPSLPEGYIVTPSAITNTIADADIDGLAFVLTPWGAQPGGDGYDEATGGYAFTVAEGETSAGEITVTETSGIAGEIEAALIYNRSVSEVLSRETVEAAAETSRTAAREAAAAAAGSDWTALDTAKFSGEKFEFVFRDGTTVAERDAFLARRGLVAVRHFTIIPASIAVRGEATAALADASLADAPASFSGADDSDILVSAQPSPVAIAIAAVPGDELYAEQWALSNSRQTGGTLGIDIGAESAWDYAGLTGSRDVLVAVTDTGIESTHPDLAANWSGLGSNYVFSSTDTGDNIGHGTHVAGIIGAVGDNAIGVCGVNWEVSLMSQRICQRVNGRDFWATEADIAASFEDAALAGAFVNNNSWGTPIYSELLYRAMKAAGEDYGMLFVCAAGNEAVDLDVTQSFPASMAEWLDNVIVVAATDCDGRIAEFSNYGSKRVHIAAPGVDIVSTYISLANGAAGDAFAASADGNYTTMSGTSMAAPYVTGAAAFLKALSPNASAAVVKEALLQGARRDPLLTEYVTTAGHLDLAMSARLLGADWIR